MEKDIGGLHEDNSGEESSSEESAGEFSVSGFTKWREFRIANASDHYIWVGLDQDRKTSTGGQSFNLSLLELFGAGFTMAQKEHTIVSRIPWKRSQYHTIDAIKYKNDTFKDETARLLVLFPQHGKRVIVQEQTVSGGETIIVGPDGTLMQASKKRMIPVGYDKKPMSKRANKIKYKDERKRQRNWVPKYKEGDIQDIIMDPHIRRGTPPKECQLCLAVFDQSLFVDRDHNQLQVQGNITGASRLPIQTESEASVVKRESDHQQR